MKMVYAELRGLIADAMKSDKVTRILKEAVCEATKNQMNEFSRVGFVDRQRVV